MDIIQTRDLRKSYRTGKVEVPVLHGVDLDIEKGEFVSIMGPSGGGKSTLMNMIGLLDTPTAGTVQLMGQDVSGLNKNERARARRDQLGFVFQAFHLMPRATTLRNVMLPLAFAGVPLGERESKARKVLDWVGLSDRVKHKPTELSGGQKQRVAIARALVLDPPILLADEPTGNLDSQTSAEVMDLFRRLHGEGKTIIQVTHDRDMAHYGNRIVNLQDGRIVKDIRRPKPEAV